MNKYHSSIWPAFVVCGLCIGYVDLAWAAGLEASLDRTRVVDGDSLTLNLVAPGDSQDNPDFTELSQDFSVLSQSQSTSMSIINGSSSSTREWQVVLMPKHPGTLVLPAIHIGGLASEPITVQVLPADQAGLVNKVRPVLVEVATDATASYVQSQVIYTVRVLSSVPMQQASLTEPKAADAIVERLGEDTHYKTEREGQSYNVIERRYAIFPQHSGILTIGSPVLSAVTPEPGGRNLVLRDPFFGVPFGDPFGNLGNQFTRPVQARGPNLTLEVKPQPAGTPSPWIPAESLQLTEAWSPDPPNFRVGEPVTRTLTVTTQGLSAAQIPELEFGLPDGMKDYPDRAQGENQTKGDSMVATKVFKHALVPTKPGQLTLPEVRLPWWNTKTNQLQVVSIPARTFEVLPAVTSTEPGAATTASQTPATGVGQQEPQEQSQEAKAKQQPSATPSSRLPKATIPPLLQLAANTTVSYWIWLAIALGTAWLLTLMLWLRERRRRIPSQQTALGITVITINKAKAKIEQSCRANDAKATRTALLAWGALRWPTQPPRRLDAMAAHFTTEAAAVLMQLDRYLYAPDTASWDGKTAWQILAPHLGVEPKPEAKSPLPSLYPA